MTTGGEDESMARRAISLQITVVVECLESTPVKNIFLVCRVVRIVGKGK
jgi:hypothetical protein